MKERILCALGLLLLIGCFTAMFVVPYDWVRPRMLLCAVVWSVVLMAGIATLAHALTELFPDVELDWSFPVSITNMDEIRDEIRDELRRRE